MAELNLAPMLNALRAHPEEFEMSHGWLRHMKSDHRFQIATSGRLQIHADCNCHLLEVNRSQAEEFRVAFSSWQVMYWQPHLDAIAEKKQAAEIERMAPEINRTFAAHFTVQSFLQRFIAKIAYRIGVIDHAEAELQGVETQRRREVTPQRERETV